MNATILDYKKNGYKQICPVHCLEETLAEIKTGVYKDTIERLRQVKKRNKAEYSKQKRVDLPAFFAGMLYEPTLPAGKCSNCIITGFKLNEGCSVLDFDDCDVEPLVDYFKDKEYCVFYFRSPGGKGLKVGIAHQEVSDYQELRRIKKSLVFDDWVMKLLDPACLDNASLKCFVSYDPGAYYNPDYVPMTVEVKAEHPGNKKQSSSNSKNVYGSKDSGAKQQGVYGRLGVAEVDELLDSICGAILITCHKDYFTTACALSLYGREDLWYKILQNNDWSQYAGSKSGFDKELADKTYNECKVEGSLRIANGHPIIKYWHLFPLLKGFNPTLVQQVNWNIPKSD